MAQVSAELAYLIHSLRVDLHTQYIISHPMSAMLAEVSDLGYVVASCSLVAAGARVLYGYGIAAHSSQYLAPNQHGAAMTHPISLHGSVLGKKPLGCCAAQFKFFLVKLDYSIYSGRAVCPAHSHRQQYSLDLPHGLKAQSHMHKR